MSLQETFHGGVVEQLIADDIETIATEFKDSFTKCINEVKKPNVLVGGVTGAGKSSLVNAVFGSSIVSVGCGIPVTKHFQKIEPVDKPVIVYDSKGLEDGFHEEFMRDTKRFFEDLRRRPNLAEHIHVIWYVINAAAGRFEPFEEILVREVFAPTPVIFILNKSDVASAQQLLELETTVHRCQFENARGIFRIASDRKNYSQSWCPRCGSDDVTYRKNTRELSCEECEWVEEMKDRFGFGPLIERTANLLPDLAKEAFLYAQVESLQQKDKFAMIIVKQYSEQVAMDVSGKALHDVGEMVGRIFVLWGWNLLGYKVSNALVREMKEEYKHQELSVRLAMIAADTILKRKLSRSVIACLGLMVNRPLRQLSEKLLAHVEKGEVVHPGLFQLHDAQADRFVDSFMKTAFEAGIPAAIDAFWYE